MKIDPNEIDDDLIDEMAEDDLLFEEEELSLSEEDSLLEEGGF